MLDVANGEVVVLPTIEEDTESLLVAFSLGALEDTPEERTCGALDEDTACVVDKVDPTEDESLGTVSVTLVPIVVTEVPPTFAREVFSTLVPSCVKTLDIDMLGEVEVVAPTDVNGELIPLVVIDSV